MDQNKNQNTPLLHSTFKQLVQLTAYISEDKFNYILEHILKISALDQLSEADAQKLIGQLSILPKLKSNLVQGLSASAEQIAQKQIDIFAEQLITGNGNPVDV